MCVILLNVFVYYTLRGFFTKQLPLGAFAAGAGVLWVSKSLVKFLNSFSKVFKSVFNTGCFGNLLLMYTLACL